MEYKILIKETGSKKYYIDLQEEEGFYLYPGEIKKLGLKDGMILSEEAVRSIHQEYSVPRAKKRALGLLAKKDMTQKELVEKLESSLNDSRAIAAAMEFVTRHGYVDDEQYARDYLYFRRDRKSFRQIQEELSRKGISREILQILFEEEGDQSMEEIRPLVVKYAARFKELDYPSQQKICQHFGRKGYQVSQIRRILDELREEDHF